MFFYVYACLAGQIQEDHGCTDICLDKFFNSSTGSCEDFSICEAWQYLNTNTNQCVSSCINGYYLNGSCICYSGFIPVQGNCSYDQNSISSQFTILGLDWFIWGLIFIFGVNIGYILICLLLAYIKIKN